MVQWLRLLLSIAGGSGFNSWSDRERSQLPRQQLDLLEALGVCSECPFVKEEPRTSLELSVEETFPAIYQRENSECLPESICSSFGQ